MAKRTLKHGKRGSRKMGGRKAKKGARKTHRKRGGGWRESLGIGTLNETDWVNGFTARRVKLGITGYRLVWVPEESSFVIDFEGMGNLASVFAKGKIFDGLKEIIADKFYGSNKDNLPPILDNLNTNSMVVFIGEVKPDTGSNISKYTGSNVLKCVLVDGSNAEYIETNPEILNGAFGKLYNEYITLAQQRGLIPVEGNPGNEIAKAAINLAKDLPPPDFLKVGIPGESL